MSTVAYYYGMVITVILLATQPIFSLHCLSCQCGSSNKNYTYCIEEDSKYSCESWKHCKTCRNNVAYCISCPPKRTGRFCTESAVELLRRKRQISTHCEQLRSIPNGRVNVFRSSSQPFEEDDFELPVGTSLHISCNMGYVLEGEANLVCENNGYWSGDRPECVKAKCKEIDPVMNGKVIIHFPANSDRLESIDKKSNSDLTYPDLTYPEGTRLHYVCDDEHILLGDSDSFCEPTGHWSVDEQPTCIEECGRYPIQESSRAHDDIRTIPGEWPWTVAITVKRGTDIIFYCTGALLDRRTVLTAAHCVEEARDYILYFGLFTLNFVDKDTYAEERTSSRVILHPDFSVNPIDSDIALITFKPPVSYTGRIQPICLPTPDSTERNLSPLKYGFMSGWDIGKTAFLPEQLQVLKTIVLTKESCEEEYRLITGMYPPLSQNMFCAGLATDNTNFCTMSGGSPLVFYSEEKKRYTLEGLVSLKPSTLCVDWDTPYVMTRVAGFMQWILEKIGV